jgi:phosphoribosylformimino-5-aminoimidazole carboxamide ribotide isomerase
MIIYPAIDLRGGRVVRLNEGRLDRETVFSDDPVAMAQRWIDEGAAWIHMVNLDGAFAEANGNGAILEKAAALGVPIQFGGGLRTLDDIDLAIARGASRVVLGTIAVQNPALVEAALTTHGAERVCVALDARDGKITTHGWQTVTDVTPVDLGRAMRKRGVQHALFTDVTRDGGLGGANLESTITLGRETGLQVIASGGVAGLDEIRSLAASGFVAGAVIGMALYRGQLALADALRVAQEGA